MRETRPGIFVENLENASFFEAFESFVTSSKSSFAKVHHSWEHFLRRSDWLDWTSSDGLLGVWKIFWPENIWEDVEFNGASLISANKVVSSSFELNPRYIFGWCERSIILKKKHKNLTAPMIFSENFTLLGSILFSRHPSPWLHQHCCYWREAAKAVSHRQVL